MATQVQNQSTQNIWDHLICPISQEIMEDPYITDPCGHTYEKEQIEGWRALKISEGRLPDCPLCHGPITSLAPNLLLKRALSALHAQNRSDLTPLRVADLQNISDAEDREAINEAVQAVEERRIEDQRKGIRDRLPQRMTFSKKVARSYGEVYSCC